MTANTKTRLFALAYAFSETESDKRGDLLREFSDSMLSVIQDGGSDWMTRREAIRPAIRMLHGHISRGEAQEISATVGNRMYLLRTLGEDEKLIDETPVILTVQHQLNAIDPATGDCRWLEMDEDGFWCVANSHLAKAPKPTPRAHVPRDEEDPAF